MAEVILVHGAWHGPWCWDKVKKQLETQGHHVITPKLPCIAENLKAISLQSYIALVEKELLALSEKAILVGHSLAGLIISDIATRYPQLIEKLIYVCAFIPNKGETLLTYSRKDNEADISALFARSKHPDILTLKPELAHRYFYNTCTKSDQELAASLLSAQAIYPMATPLFWIGSSRPRPARPNSWN